MSYTTTAPAFASFRPRVVNSDSGRGLVYLNGRLAQLEHTNRPAPSLLAVPKRAFESEHIPRAAAWSPPREENLLPSAPICACMPALAHPRPQRPINRAEIALASLEAEAKRVVHPAPPRVDCVKPKSLPRPPPLARARSDPGPAAQPRGPPPYPFPRRRNPEKLSAPAPIKTQPFGPIDTATEFGALLASYAEQLRGTPLEVDASVVFV